MWTRILNKQLLFDKYLVLRKNTKMITFMRVFTTYIIRNVLTSIYNIHPFTCKCKKCINMLNTNLILNETLLLLFLLYYNSLIFQIFFLINYMWLVWKLPYKIIKKSLREQKVRDMESKKCNGNFKGFNILFEISTTSRH